MWICRSDAQPWPCADARLTLVREYRHRPVALCVYLGLSLAEAMRDLYQLNAAECPTPKAMNDRFMAWAAIRRSRPSDAGQPATPGEA